MTKLQALLAGAENPCAIADKSFVELLKESGHMDSLEDEPVASEQGGADPSEVVRALADRPSHLADLQFHHRNALAVLRGLPRGSVDLRSARASVRDGKKLVVAFDNCTHSSGKQRCYIRCAGKHHHACFKYSVVDRFENASEAACWLMAWAEHARDMPPAFTKKDHEKFVPTTGQVDSYRDLLQDEPV